MEPASNPPSSQAIFNHVIWGGKTAFGKENVSDMEREGGGLGGRWCKKKVRICMQGRVTKQHPRLRIPSNILLFCLQPLQHPLPSTPF